MAGAGGVLCVLAAADGIREADEPGHGRDAAGDGDDGGPRAAAALGDNGLSILNKTLPGHILYDGQVLRTATQAQDGSWSVTTYGIGNNVIPGMNELNQDAGPGIFKTLDQNMAAALRKK